MTQDGLISGCICFSLDLLLLLLTILPLDLVNDFYSRSLIPMSLSFSPLVEPLTQDLHVQVQQRNVKHAALQNAALYVDHGQVLVLRDEQPSVRP